MRPSQICLKKLATPINWSIVDYRHALVRCARKKKSPIMSTANDKYSYLLGEQSVSRRAWEERKLLLDAYHKADPRIDHLGDAVTLAEHLCLAVQTNKIGAVKWLLENGVHPCQVPDGCVCLFDYALTENRLNTGRLEVAVLVRKHGMPLPNTLVEVAREWISYYSAPQKMRWPHNRRIIRQLQDLIDPHREEPSKVACYSWAACNAADNPVIVPSQPARIKHWLPTDVVPGSTHMPMLKHKAHLCKLRRVEARVLAPFNWKRLRVLIKMRGIAFYWLEETQKRLCAPGGAGRAEDLAAYRDAFA